MHKKPLNRYLAHSKHSIINSSGVITVIILGSWWLPEQGGRRGGLNQGHTVVSMFLNGPGYTLN